MTYDPEAPRDSRRGARRNVEAVPEWREIGTASTGETTAGGRRRETSDRRRDSLVRSWAGDLAPWFSASEWPGIEPATVVIRRG